MLAALPFRDFDADRVRNEVLANQFSDIPEPGTVRVCLPPGPPVLLQDWDFVRFRLGFPGLRFILDGDQGWFEAEVHCWAVPLGQAAGLTPYRQAELEQAGAPWRSPDRLRRPKAAASRTAKPSHPRVIVREDLPSVIAGCRTDAASRITAYPCW